MTLKMFEEGDNLYIEIAGDPSLKKKIKEGLSSLVGKELVEEISGLLPKEEKPKIPDNWLDAISLTPKEDPKEESQDKNNQQDKDDWDDWGEPKKQEEPKAAETEEVTIIADDDDDW